MKRIKKRNFQSIRLIGLLLVILGVAMTIYLQVRSGKLLEKAVLDFASNQFGVQLFGMGLTVVLIDWLYEKRDEREKKYQLIKELGSLDRSLSTRAALELSSRNWLSDGTLKKSILLNANLERADLDEADFSFCNLEEANFKLANIGGGVFHNIHGKNANFVESFLEKADFYSAHLWKANFVSANLRNAGFANADLWQANFEKAYLQDCLFTRAVLKSVNFREAKYLTQGQLAVASELCAAIMPDGSRYDGRYQLPGDLANAKERKISIEDDVAMADFYGVPVDIYLSGLHQ